MQTPTSDLETFDLRFLLEEPADVYESRADVFLTAQALHEFRRSPVAYHRRRLGLALERNPWIDRVGEAGRMLILHGRAHDSRRPLSGWKSSVVSLATFFSKLRAPLLSRDDVRTVEQMNSAVHRHAVAREILADGVADRVVRGDYAGHPCQARPDWINPNTDRGILQLEFVHNLDSLESLAVHNGHLHEAAFSRALLATVCGQVFPVHIIAVERVEPFRVGAWRIASDVLDHAQHENEETLEAIRRCHQADTWPTGFEDLRLIDRI